MIHLLGNGSFPLADLGSQWCTCLWQMRRTICYFPFQICALAFATLVFPSTESWISLIQLLTVFFVAPIWFRSTLFLSDEGNSTTVGFWRIWVWRLHHGVSRLSTSVPSGEVRSCPGFERHPPGLLTQDTMLVMFLSKVSYSPVLVSNVALFVASRAQCFCRRFEFRIASNCFASTHGASLGFVSPEAMSHVLPIVTEKIWEVCSRERVKSEAFSWI